MIKDGISHCLLPIRCGLILMLRGFNSSLKFIILILVFKYTNSSRPLSFLPALILSAILAYITEHGNLILFLYVSLLI